MRLFCVFASACLAGALLVGCSPSDTGRAREIQEGLSQHYQTDVRCQAGALEIEAQIVRPDPGSCTITVTAPESLVGLVYEMGRDGVLVSYRELNFSLDASGNGASAPLLRAASALSLLLTPGQAEAPSPKDGGWEITAALYGVDYALWLDGETGLPAKLSPGDGQPEILLDDFVFFG